MSRSGVISIQSHTYDMHQNGRYDYPLRDGVLRMEGETEAEYVEAFKHDFALMSKLLSESAEERLFAFSYPYGSYDIYSSILLREAGVSVTLSTRQGLSTLIKGLPQSLYELKRFSAVEAMTGEDIVNLCSVEL